MSRVNRELIKSLSDELSIEEEKIPTLIDQLIRHPKFQKELVGQILKEPWFYDALTEKLAKDESVRDRVIKVFSNFYGRRSLIEGALMGLVGATALGALVGKSKADTYIIGRKTNFSLPNVMPYSAAVYIDGTEVRAENWKGKEIASGTAGVDDAAVIQSALDVGGKIFIKAGSYNVVDLEIDSNTYIYGEGINKTVLVANGDGEAIIKCKGTEGNNKNRIGLCDLCIYGNERQYSIDGLVLEYVEYPYISHVWIHRVKGYGLKLKQVWDGQFYSTIINYCGDSATNKQSVTLLNGDTWPTNSNFFYGLVVTGSYYDFIYINGKNNKFIGLKLHGTSTMKYRGVIIEPDSLPTPPGTAEKNLIVFGDEIAYLTDVVVIETGANYNIIKDLTGLDRGTTNRALVINGKWNKVINVRSDSQTVGIEINGDQNKLVNIEVYRASSDGIVITGDRNTLQNVDIVECQNGIYISGGKFNEIIGGHINDNVLNGVYIYGGANYNKVEGLVIMHNEGAGVLLKGSLYNIIEGNHIYDFGTPIQDYGVRELSTSDYNIIESNYITNHAVADYDIIGSHTYCDEWLYTSLPADGIVVKNKPIHYYDSAVPAYYLAVWDGSTWRKIQIA